MGFRSIPWNSTPADASAAPTNDPAMTRGSRIRNRMVSSLDCQVAVKWKSPVLFSVIFIISSGDMGTAPRETAMSRQKSRNAPNASRIKSRRFCFSLVNNFNNPKRLFVKPALRVIRTSNAECNSAQASPQRARGGSILPRAPARQRCADRGGPAEYHR